MSKITQDRFFLSTGLHGEIELRYRGEDGTDWYVLQINQDGTLSRNIFLPAGRPFKTDGYPRDRIAIKEDPLGEKHQ